MKKIIFLPIILAIVFCSIPFMPTLPMSIDKQVSENRLLITFDHDDCGSYVPKVLDGADELEKKLKNEYPDICTKEVRFTEDSITPAEKSGDYDYYTSTYGTPYIIEGEVVGMIDTATSNNPEPENRFVPEYLGLIVNGVVIYNVNWVDIVDKELVLMNKDIQTHPIASIMLENLNSLMIITDSGIKEIL